MQMSRSKEKGPRITYSSLGMCKLILLLNQPAARLFETSSKVVRGNADIAQVLLQALVEGNAEGTKRAVSKGGRGLARKAIHKATKKPQYALLVLALARLF